MRPGGIAFLAVLALAVASAAPATAANPITVVLTGQNASSTTGQACVSAVITDSVTNAPLAADVELVINGGPFNTENLQLKTDPTGKGTLCFNEPGTFPSATVTLSLAGGIVVHANPDYGTTGSSNTVTVRWGTSTPLMAITPTSTSSTLVVGQVDTVDVKLQFGTQSTLPAVSPTLEIDPSGASATVTSATANSGSCSGSTTVSCTFADLVPGAQANVELKLQPSTAGTLALAFTARWHTVATAVNTGQTITMPGSATGSLSLPVAVPSADLSVALTAPKGKLHAGKQASFSAVVRNAGPQAGAAIVSFKLPSGLRVIRFQGDDITCQPSARTCSVGSLSPSARTTVVVTVEPSRAGLLHLSAAVAVTGAATDPNSQNNSAKLTLTALAAPKR